MIAKARGRSEGGGNLSLSLHPSHLPLSSRSSALWGGTRPLIIPFIAHRGPKEGCERTRKRRPPRPRPPPPPPCAHFGPADCYGPECPLINETIQSSRRRRLLNSEILWNVPFLLLLRSSERFFASLIFLVSVLANFSSLPSFSFANLFWEMDVWLVLELFLFDSSLQQWYIESIRCSSCSRNILSQLN